ncbi:hypothetical protein AB6E94_19620 [Vibrio lentus]|uniref:hypothetical protein n=1 Tax=Vibrio splendidus TaxID=29497 RepID=UPI000C82B58E|nr:hypothetical protein [Vibrio splendidus]PMG17912.1 hypothetical protein BCU98_00840 [Vibrio splendidus]
MSIIPVMSGYYRDDSFMGVVTEVQDEVIVKLDTGKTVLISQALINNASFFIKDNDSATEMLFWYLKRNWKFSRVIVLDNHRYTLKFKSLYSVSVFGNGRSFDVVLNCSWWRVPLSEIVSLAYNLGTAVPAQRKIRFQVLKNKYESTDYISLINVGRVLEIYQDLFDGFHQNYQKELSVMRSPDVCEIRRSESCQSMLLIIQKISLRVEYLQSCLSEDIQISKIVEN